MKTLLLLRHAKSSWGNPELRDFDRPLNERGLKAAPLMGEFMKRQGMMPDLIISSPAERARQTAQLVIQAAELKAPVRFDERIYEASVEQLIHIVSEIEQSIEEALLIGHNYGIESLLARLTGDAKHMSTAALARIVLPMDSWREVSEKTGRLDLFVKPKELSAK